MDIFWYFNIPNVTAGYGRFSDSMALFENFHILLHVRHVITSSNFYKLYVKVELKSKSIYNQFWVYYFSDGKQNVLLLYMKKAFNTEMFISINPVFEDKNQVFLKYIFLVFLVCNVQFWWDWFSWTEETLPKVPSGVRSLISK